MWILTLTLRYWFTGYIFPWDFFAMHTWTKMFSPSSPENFSSAPLMNLASPPFGFKGVDSLSQSWKNSIKAILKHGEHFFPRGQINKMHFSHGMQTNSGYPQYFNTINVRIKLRDVATWYFIYRWDTTEEAIIKHYPSSFSWPPWNDFFVVFVNALRKDGLPCWELEIGHFVVLNLGMLLVALSSFTQFNIQYVSEKAILNLIHT